MKASRAPLLLLGAILLAGLAACETADIGGADQCRAAYARARTAADTAVADAKATTAHASVTCGTLRQAGKLTRSAQPPRRSPAGSRALAV